MIAWSVLTFSAFPICSWARWPATTGAFRAPRTISISFWFLRRAEVEPLAAAFAEGFFLQRESIQTAFSPPHQFNALDEQSALKVDFWLLKDDPFERVAFQRRQEVSLFGTPAWITTAEDVILHKFYWHTISPSDRQLLDAAGVYAIQVDALDTFYLRHWAPILGVEQLLDALVSGKNKPKST